jgi:cytochrome c556
MKKKFHNRMRFLSALILGVFLFQVTLAVTGILPLAAFFFFASASLPFVWKESGVLATGGASGTEEPTEEQKLIKKFQDEIASYMKREKIVTEERLKHISDALEELKKNAAPTDLSAIKTELTTLAQDINALKEKGQPSLKDLNFVKALKNAIHENKDKFAKLKNKEIKHLEINIVYKASQVPTDIADRDDYAQFMPGTNRKPVRDTFIRDLFRKIPVSREYVRYREENTVTRDAKVVIACAASTHNTKKTWINRTVQIQKIRDMIDICIDMIDDYDFVEAEVKQLVDESVKLKGDAEMFNGTGDILSIESICSEFDAANVLAPYDGASGKGFKFPTIAQLTAAMKAQIYTFGQNKKWQADTILMNENDKTRFLHEKDSTGQYLLPRFIETNGGILNNMQIVTNPLVAENTLYVLDSRQGTILDRQMMTLEFSYENNDNFETETVTVKAVERLQFHVKQIDRDAFMMCSDIEAALTAITNI